MSSFKTSDHKIEVKLIYFRPSRSRLYIDRSQIKNNNNSELPHTTISETYCHLL